MLAIVFLVLVVLGFTFMLLAEWPVHPYTRRLAWACWLIASLIWASTRLAA